MLSTVLIYIFFAGMLLAAAGYLWLIFKAIQLHWGWVLVSLAAPLGPLLFALLKFRHAFRATLTLFTGVLLVTIAFVLGALDARINLGERDVIVNGRRALTLTGWNETDYSLLRATPDAAVLQLANPDVTDGTLEYIAGYRQLEELDLGRTHISDEGLRKLTGLRTLKRLRLTGTRITTEGLRDLLTAVESLKQLDVRETGVERVLLEQWRTAQPGRAFLHSPPATEPAAPKVDPDAPLSNESQTGEPESREPKPEGAKSDEAPAGGPATVLETPPTDEPQPVNP